MFSMFVSPGLQALRQFSSPNTRAYSAKPKLVVISTPVLKFYPISNQNISGQPRNAGFAGAGEDLRCMRQRRYVGRAVLHTQIDFAAQKHQNEGHLLVRSGLGPVKQQLSQMWI